MAKKTKKRRNKFRMFILLICLSILSVFIGVKSGEYMAYKLTNPSGENESMLSGFTGESNAGNTKNLSEDDMVSLTAIITEFVAAEHNKKAEKLASLSDLDYYNTLLKSIRSLTAADISIEEINFKEVSEDDVGIEAVFTKKGKRLSETVRFKKIDNTWKVINVKR
ncbi:hypothetical protein OXPF_05290 [Oxobacter pfennigii]|uniref:Lumazine-binding domain protein n=1 Tax=Oxobacter pfennigii TaxID=36849 RepID=A0A0N8NTX5_9CLOT|nr:hypothetical protein [Oxobacter pfennigii]KPU46048.1 hypothetical protein OXPF_05290 [Oxobacter pfennigii]